VWIHFGRRKEETSKILNFNLSADAKEIAKTSENLDKMIAYHEARDMEKFSQDTDAPVYERPRIQKRNLLIRGMDNGTIC
jgi:hypothetical protein